MQIDPALIELTVGGPIDLMCYVLNSAHNLTGLPWWATLAACTLTVRTCMVPLVVRQMGNVQRLQIIKKDVDAISEKMKAVFFIIHSFLHWMEGEERKAPISYPT